VLGGIDVRVVPAFRIVVGVGGVGHGPKGCNDEGTAVKKLNGAAGDRVGWARRMRPPIACCAAAASLAIFTAASTSRAACPSIARGSLSEPGARLSGQWLYDARMRDARRARTWRYAWSGINGTFAVASFALMPFVSRDQRIELAVGGAYSTVATVFTWFVPLEVESTLDRKTRPVDLCRGLRLEEEATASAAADEVARVTWPWHVLNVGAGALYTVIVGVTTDRWANGVVDGVLTVAIGEAQLFTQPTRLADQWTAYGSLKNPRRAFWVVPSRETGVVVNFGTTF
jgi:hypothetical protein